MYNLALYYSVQQCNHMMSVYCPSEINDCFSLINHTVHQKDLL